MGPAARGDALTFISLEDAQVPVHGWTDLMDNHEPPVVVVSVHLPLLAEALARVLQRGLASGGPIEPPGAAVQVITLDREPDRDALHVLRLPETVGNPAVLESPGRSVSLVLWTLDDVAGLVGELLLRR